MFSVVIGLLLFVTGLVTGFHFMKLFRDPTSSKRYQKASLLAEEYTIPVKCRIERCVYGFSPYTEISLLSQPRGPRYKVPVMTKESELGAVHLFYRHQEEETSFVPDYMVYDADVKYLKQKAFIGMLLSMLVACAGILIAALL